MRLVDEVADLAFLPALLRGGVDRAIGEFGEGFGHDGRRLGFPGVFDADERRDGAEDQGDRDQECEVGHIGHDWLHVGRLCRPSVGWEPYLFDGS